MTINSSYPFVLRRPQCLLILYPCSHTFQLCCQVIGCPSLNLLYLLRYEQFYIDFGLVKRCLQGKNLVIECAIVCAGHGVHLLKEGVVLRHQYRILLQVRLQGSLGLFNVGPDVFGHGIDLELRIHRFSLLLQRLHLLQLLADNVKHRQQLLFGVNGFRRIDASPPCA